MTDKRGIRLEGSYVLTGRGRQTAELRDVCVVRGAGNDNGEEWSACESVCATVVCWKEVRGVRVDRVFGGSDFSVVEVEEEVRQVV